MLETNHAPKTFVVLLDFFTVCYIYDFYQNCVYCSENICPFEYNVMDKVAVVIMNISLLILKGTRGTSALTYICIYLYMYFIIPL